MAECRLLLLPECVSFCDLETIPSSRWLAIGRGKLKRFYVTSTIDQSLKDVAVERLLLFLKSARSVRWTQKTIPLCSSSRLPCPLHSWQSKFARRAGRLYLYASSRAIGSQVIWWTCLFAVTKRLEFRLLEW